MTAREKQELDELQQDVAALARLLMDDQGAKPVLLAIIERYSTTALETRPAEVHEQREAVRA